MNKGGNNAGTETARQDSKDEVHEKLSAGQIDQKTEEPEIDIEIGERNERPPESNEQVGKTISNIRVNAEILLKFKELKVHHDTSLNLLGAIINKQIPYLYIDFDKAYNDSKGQS